MAAESGYPDVVELLLMRKANGNIKSSVSKLIYKKKKKKKKSILWVNKYVSACVLVVECC